MKDGYQPSRGLGEPTPAFPHPPGYGKAGFVIGTAGLVIGVVALLWVAFSVGQSPANGSSSPHGVVTPSPEPTPTAAPPTSTSGPLIVILATRTATPRPTPAPRPTIPPICGQTHQPGQPCSWPTITPTISILPTIPVCDPASPAPGARCRWPATEAPPYAD